MKTRRSNKNSKPISRDKVLVFIVEVDGIKHAIDFLFNWDSKNVTATGWVETSPTEMVRITITIGNKRGRRQLIKDLEVLKVTADVTADDTRHEEPDYYPFLGTVTYNKDMPLVGRNAIKGMKLPVAFGTSFWYTP